MTPTTPDALRRLLQAERADDAEHEVYRRVGRLLEEIVENVVAATGPATSTIGARDAAAAGLD